MTIETFPIIDRASWLLHRQQDVTASVAGCLLGVHEYQTRFGLWALKTGRITEDPEESPAMQRGRLLEPVAIQLLREKRPDIRIQPGATYYREVETRIGGTPDAMALCPTRGAGIIQIKSVEPSIFRKKWIDPDTREITPPLWIAVQAIVEAYLTGSTWAAVAPMRVSHGIDIDLIDIPIHAGILDAVKAEVAKFWALCESGEAPEPDMNRDGETIERLYGADNGDIVDLTGDNEFPELVARYAGLRAAAKEAEDGLTSVKAALQYKIGNHAVATAPGISVSWKTQHRKAYTVQANSFRVLRVTDKRQKEAAE